MSDDVQEAMQRARRHLRNATMEGLEATRALVDAALRAGGLGDAGASSVTEDLRRALDDWIAALEDDRLFRMPKAVSEPLFQALDAEIHRWEQRSARDESARPVLRTFLGLRELLWEIGMRPNASPSPDDPHAPNPKRPRVQRFDIED